MYLRSKIALGVSGLVVTGLVVIAAPGFGALGEFTRATQNAAETVAQRLDPSPEPIAEGKTPTSAPGDDSSTADDSPAATSSRPETISSRSVSVCASGTAR